MISCQLEMDSKRSSGDACGHEISADGVSGIGDVDAALDALVEEALLEGVLAQVGLSRRRFVQLLGTGSLAGLLSAVLPLDEVKASVRDSGSAPLKRSRVDIAFMPIACATPLICAESLGFFRRNGLEVRLRKANAWAMVRDWMLAGEVDAAHLLAPMPLASQLGIAPTRTSWLIPAIENVNGQAITLSMKHAGVTRVDQLEGLQLGVPHEYSIHNYLLRHLLAESGLDPDRDVKIRVLPPLDLLESLRSGRIDGYLGPDPFNQLAVHEGVGFIFMLSKEIWDGHPCCALTIPRGLAETFPDTFIALLRSMLQASHHASLRENRADIASVVAQPMYLDQPKEVLREVLTGDYRDGLGGTHSVPDRIDFDPFPMHSAAIWILTQMKRWNHVASDVDYGAIARDVCMAAECDVLLRELGIQTRNSSDRTPEVLGSHFDPDQPEAYLEDLSRRSASARNDSSRAWSA